jgi:ABC-type protease/lipase transport system fused ATPase/permease subunit
VVLGVWPAVAGTVRLDGAEIGQWNQDELGPYVGYLPQDIELFEGTVAQNIARFGEVDSDKVVHAAQQAKVHDLILRLPQGYETLIGADGGALAAGQRQRIALARAFYGQPRLIVLDEPDAHLDDAGGIALQQALANAKAWGATVLVITHRPRLLQGVDRVLVLRDGSLIDNGDARFILKKYLQPAVAAAGAGPARSDPA